MKTLIVPIDFSVGSERALEVALNIAAPLGLEPILLHVFEPPFTAGDISPVLVQTFFAEAVPATRAALEELARKNGVHRTLFREGAPGPEIVRAAKEEDPRFVVMGTHGRTKLRHLVTGSVAAYVIRHSPVPVITVRDTIE